MSGEGRPGIKAYVLAVALIAVVSFLALTFLGSGSGGMILSTVGNSV